MTKVLPLLIAVASGDAATGTAVLQVYDLGKDGTGTPSEIYAVKDLTEAARNNTRGDWTAPSACLVVTLVLHNVVQILLVDGSCALAMMSAALLCACLWLVQLHSACWQKGLLRPAHHYTLACTPAKWRCFSVRCTRGCSMCSSCCPFPGGTDHRNILGSPCRPRDLQGEEQV